MTKLREKERARELRRQGLSLNEVVEQIDAAKSTVSGWVRDIMLTDEQQQRLVDRQITSAQKGRIKAAQTLRKQRRRRWNAYMRDAESEWETLSLNPLFMLGLGLYLGDGDKRSMGTVGFANCNPVIIKAHLGFLEIIGVVNSNVHCCIHISTALEHRIECIADFWRDTTGLPESQFQKTIVDRRSRSGLDSKSKWRNGICTILVFNTELKIKINRWMDLACENLGA